MREREREKERERGVVEIMPELCWNKKGNDAFFIFIKNLGSHLFYVSVEFFFNGGNLIFLSSFLERKNL